MEIADLHPGTYVIAVSGGVDSVVLLDLLAKKAKKNVSAKHKAIKQNSKTSHSPTNAPGFRLIVAHYDHGIRVSSHLDRKLVQKLSEKYGLQFIYDEGKLGPKTSEAMARRRRYEFLKRVMSATNAEAVITAHHQDDLLETAVINLSRGTSHRGLAALSNKNWLLRPLLNIPKPKIINYAKERSLQWREDSTNTDEKYTRNYIRHRILNQLNASQRKELVSLVNQVRQASWEIDSLLKIMYARELNSKCLERKLLINMDYVVALEFMAAWLRCHEVRDFDKKTLSRLVVATKTALSNTEVDVINFKKISLSKDKFCLTSRKPGGVSV